MQQLSIFDSPVKEPECKVGFRYRWHLVDNGVMAATVIPSTHSVTIMGMYQTMLSHLNIKISYADYERFIEISGLTEVKP